MSKYAAFIVISLFLVGCGDGRNQPGENRPYNAKEQITCPTCGTVAIAEECEKNKHFSVLDGSFVGINCPECRTTTYRRPLE